MIYLDYAATTPCLPEVVEAMSPFFGNVFANASSVDHYLGAAAKDAVEQARHEVAQLVGARSDDVIFTGGATEANNLALNNDLPLLTGRIEHPSVLEPARRIGSSRTVQWLSPDSDGLYSLEELTEKVHPSTTGMLISLMSVNNEIGTIQPIQQFAAKAQEAGALFHTDATQAAANLPVSIDGLDAISISAHKLYGPKGIGALISRASLRKHLRPLVLGGGHERGLRSGTLNVPAIVGFGVAARIARESRRERERVLKRHRNLLIHTIRTAYASTMTVNAPDAAAHICSIVLHRTNSRALLNATRDSLCFSLGSACATNKSEPSYVLTEIGLERAQANETIRCSLSHLMTESDVASAGKTLATAANRLLEYATA